jgi:type-F conjugative transfer system pilin assembly protein TrbC
VWRGVCWAYRQFAIFLFVVFLCFTAVAWYRGAHAAEARPPVYTDADLEKAIAEQRARSAEVMDKVDARARAYQATPPPLRLQEQRKGQDPLAVAHRYRVQDEAARAAQQQTDLLAFVSFSMPAESLARLAREAARTGAVLVFRGLKDNSLKATSAAFLPYSKIGARAQIDPTAFKKYKVASVPRYVLNHGALMEGCQTEVAQCDAQALSVGGDVSLEYALERMAASRHSLAPRAEAYLARLRGGT